MRSLLRDPFGLVLLGQTLLLVLVVVLASAFGPWAALCAGGLGALALAVAQVHALARVRGRIAQLAEEAAGEPDGSMGAGAALSTLVTRLEQARESLAGARRKAEHERDDVLGILEATTEGILVLGHSNRIEMLNDAARRILRPPVDPLGRSLQEVVRNTEMFEFAEALRRGGTPARRTVEIALGPEHRTVRLSGSLVRSDRLRRRAVLVLDDLSELTHLDRVRTDFVANVTHEMRSPLASILGYAEILAEEPGLSAEARDYLERILRNSRRLDDIIRDLIELSRLEDATAPHLEPVDLGALLAEVVAGFEDAARDRGLELSLEAGVLPATLPLDAALLRQALSNLCDNAIKYTPPGGAVRVEARVVQGEQPVLRIDVADTGRGIPADQRARIFERFYRVDTARSRSVGGTGLGLAIVKHATAVHGGHVELVSSGAGSTFSVVVPLPDARAGSRT